MEKLRLKRPTVPSPTGGEGERLVIDVSVAAPVPHLDGIYSYRNDGVPVNLGSAVEVPFGNSESYGFIVALRPERAEDSSLKKISKVLHLSPLFTEKSLIRYREIAERYGGSLFAILSSAAPSWLRSSSTDLSVNVKRREPVNSSAKDADYLSSLFHESEQVRSLAGRSEERHLLLPIGVPWERVVVSLFLENPIPTLVLVPTDRSLSILQEALVARGVESFVALTSGMKKSERARAHQELIVYDQRLVVGTRTAALAPFDPGRVLILDPGDSNYLELRAPHLRADDLTLWSSAKELITLSHSRDLSLLATQATYQHGISKGKYQFFETSSDRVVSDLKNLIASNESTLSILVSVTDRGFGNGLICKSCRNRTLCSCGFPLRIPQRGDSPECSKCFTKYEVYRCRFCSGSELVATKAGSEALAITLAKSIKQSRVHLSNTSEPRVKIEKSKDQDIVISTHGLEPRVIDSHGNLLGYDIIIMLGGRAAFSGASLSRSDRVRRNWGRLLGLANASQAKFLIDLESHHPEFQELKRMNQAEGLRLVLQERRELDLPPFSVLVELKGETAALHQLRTQLLSDEIFESRGNEIFPVHHGKMTIRVLANQRVELLRLLQSVTRIRSAKRLPVISYRLTDE